MPELNQQFGLGADSASIEPQLSAEELSSWHRRYMDRLIAVAGLTEEQAQECLDAGMSEYDYSDSAEDAADDEMSYWSE